MSLVVTSASAGSLPIRCTTSARKPSTPRPIQKRSTSCMAATTSGLSHLRSGCWGRNVCRYHCSVASSHVHAGPPPNAAGQLLGGVSGAPSRHRYHERFDDDRDERLSTNQGCWSEVWLGTQSSRTRSPR